MDDVMNEGAACVAEWCCPRPSPGLRAARPWTRREGPSGPHGGPARILVVDDDPDLCDMLTISLAAEGYAVGSARDGRAALEEVTRCAPELMLLDLWLPELDGRGVAASLRATGKTIPLIVVSAAVEGSAVAHEMGAAAFLEKPFAMDDLLSVVACVLGSACEA